MDKAVFKEDDDEILKTEEKPAQSQMTPDESWKEELKLTNA